MGKIVVIGDKYTVTLFKLLGTEAEEVSDPSIVDEIIRKYSKREDVDLVLLTQDLYQPAREKVEEVLKSMNKPIVSIIPSPFSEMKPLDVRKMIMQALGFG
ncbi:MAG: V-type ATP synthase subunit F [Sulfolobaceae archaeon]|nr:V-type ATP synthase subunit F [Sulfolobaceae archaeon]